MRMAAKQQAIKGKTKKEQKRIENELIDFGSKVINEIEIEKLIN